MECNTDGILFFTKSIIDLDNIGVAVSATSNIGAAENMRGNTDYKYWRSVDSDDLTTEEIIFTFEEQTFNRIHLVENNFLDFSIQYFDGSNYVDFSTPILETTDTETTNYYQFDAVQSKAVKILVTKTHVADDQKKCAQVLISTELHQLRGFPSFAPSFEWTKIKKQTIRGRNKSAYLDEIFSCTLNLSRYPVASDIAFFKNLFDRRREFLIWPCGGKETIFRFDVKGTRKKDIYLCEIDGDINHWFDNNTYELGINGNLKITQVN